MPSALVFTGVPVRFVKGPLCHWMMAGGLLSGTSQLIITVLPTLAVMVSGRVDLSGNSPREATLRVAGGDISSLFFMPATHW